MAWGGGGGGAWGARGGTGVDDWVQRLEANDASLTSLTVLRFRKFGHEQVTALCAALRSNTSLKELYASGHAMTAETAAVVAGMLRENTSLASLCVGSADFGDDGVAALAAGLSRNATLKRLDLENKGVGPAGAAALAESPGGLQELLLARNPRLGDDGVAALAASAALVRGLRLLDLRACGVGARGMAALGSALAASGAPGRRVLLAANALESPDDARSACTALGAALSARSIAHLDLTSCLTSDGVPALVGALSGEVELSLGLSKCGVTEDGCRALGEAVRRGVRFAQLDLSNNAIWPSGVACLARALASSPGVAELDLAGCRGGDDGTDCAEAVAALAAIPQLRRLSLFDNALGCGGAQALAASVAGGGFRDLTTLVVAGNGLSLDDIRGLLRVLCADGAAPTLRSIEVAANPGASDEGIEAVVADVQASRPGLDVAWRATGSADPGSPAPAAPGDGSG
ncbi:unnamed protein product [Pedinophyceae sp. YPF-701]|nr:unnamed protein product [Pedinophyceae sp. YPF-701]